MVIARLKPGVTGAAAEPALKTLAANLEQAYPVEQKDQTFMTTRLSRFATSTSPHGDGEIKMLAPMLFGMAGVVLLVACLNLANMLLARGTARRKEIAFVWRWARVAGESSGNCSAKDFFSLLLGGAVGSSLGFGRRTCSCTR